MGDLKGMIDFLKGANKNLDEIQKKLNDIQTYFNNNFNNVNTIRMAELEFLQDSFFKDPRQFPDEVSALYKKSLKTEEDAFEKNLRDLEKKRTDIDKQFIAANNDRLNYFKKVKDKNSGLDKREENLKLKVAKLEEDISAYNKTIDDLNTGLGFITNLFKMRSIQEQKDKLLSKRDALADEIEDIRKQWETATSTYRSEERDILEKWTMAQAELSMITEKIENLRANRDRIIKKAAFVCALNEIKGNEGFISQKLKVNAVKACPRCKSENTSNKFFCHYCGERFDKDRPDIMGSLGEVGELNTVHANLLKGITGSVSILALIKGIGKGVTEFTKSVESVKSSEDKYPLPKLKIDVPDFTKKLADKIGEMNPKVDVKFFNLHPVEFSTSFKDFTDKDFTEANIEKFFTGMGDELNKTTKQQWK